MNGAFLMSREIFDHEVFTDIIKFRVFFWIIGHAVFSEKGVVKGGIRINRGQYLRSYRNLREDLVYFDKNTEKRYSLSTVKDKIEILVEEGSLTIEETKLGTLFTVVNYEQYQGFERYKNNEKEEGPNTKGTPAEHLPNGNGTPKEHLPNNKNLGIKDINAIKDIKDLAAAEERAHGSSGPTDYQQRLLHRYVQLRGYGFDPSPKDITTAKGIEAAGVPLDIAIQALEKKFNDYEPKHTKDRINSLAYCEGFIMDAHFEALEPKGEKRYEANGRYPGRTAGKSADDVLAAAQRDREAWGG